MNDNERVIVSCLLNNATDLQALLVKILAEGHVELPDADELLRLETSIAQLAESFYREYRYWERTVAKETAAGA